MRFTPAVFILILVPFVSLLGTAQDPVPAVPTQESTPVIRTETRLVVVDAVVTDKKGNHLRDLTPAEFRLFEDNKQQTIKSVSLEHLNKIQSAPPAHIVLFFGRMSTSELIDARNNADKFIAASVSPKRVIAVINYLDAGNVKVAQGFTADANRLSQALKTLKTSAHVEQVETGVGPAGEFFTGPLASDGRNRDTSQSDPTAPFRGVGETSDIVGRNLLFAIRNVSKIMASTPGRKAIVLMSPLSDYKLEPRDFPDIISACNKANVALYTVDTRGGANRAVENTLEPLIMGTGGFATNNPNDISHALERITEDQDEHYVITYSPSKSPEDVCHALKLTVIRAGTLVRAREQYCNIKPDDPLVGTSLDRDLEVRIASAQPGNMSAAMQTAYFYTAPGAARVHMTAEIPTTKLNFEKQNGKPHSTLNVLGIAYREDGTISARFSDSVDLDFENNNQVDQFKRHPYSYEKQFSMVPGQYSLKVVFSIGTEDFAKLESPLQINPTDDKHLALGGLVLCREFSNTAGKDSGLSLLVNRVALVSRGIEYVPASATRFKNTDTVGVYFELYEPRLKEVRPPTLQFRIRVVDQKTGEIKNDSEVMSVSLAKWVDPVLPVGWKIPIDKLTPGAYRLEVIALDTKGETPLVRTTNFEIE